MNLRAIAQPMTWTVPAATGAVRIAGWDFGGEGPPALLHHANGMCGALWAPVAAQLARRFRVFAIDARGHGDSRIDATPTDPHWTQFIDDLAEVARQVAHATGTERIALGVGSSFGGIITAAAEATTAADAAMGGETPATGEPADGSLFERIVLLDPPIHPSAQLLADLEIDVPISANRRVDIVEQTLRRRWVWPSRQAARAAWQDKPLFASWDPRAFDLYLNEGMRDRSDGQVELKCHPTVEAYIFATTGGLGPLDYAPRVSVPVALVHAGNGFFDIAVHRAVAGSFPRGELHSLPAGHMLPLEAPQAVADWLLAWATAKAP